MYLGLLASSQQSGVYETDLYLGGWFRGKQHAWIGVFSSTLDGLITALVVVAMEFFLQDFYISQ